MSIAQMSAALRKEILARLREQYGKTSGRTADKRLEAYLNFTSSDQIRADTDTSKGRHEALMSRGGFNNLVEDFNKVLQESQISSILSQSMGSSITYDAFQAYAVEKLGDPKSSTRVAGNFQYSGASRSGSDSGVTTAKFLGESNSERDVLILRNYPIGKLKNLFAEFLAENLETSSTKLEARKDIEKLLNSGHLTGVFTARFVRALGLRKDNSGNVIFDSNRQSIEAQKAETELNKIIRLVTDADYLTSNIVNDLELFAVTDKRLYSNKVDLKLTTEVQFALGNQEVGKLLNAAGASLSKLTQAVKEGGSLSGQEAATDKALQSLYKNLQKVKELVDNRVEVLKKLDSGLSKEARDNLIKIAENSKAIEAIINTPGSRSVPQFIGDLIEDTIRGIKTKSEFSKAQVAEKLFKTSGAVKSKSPKVRVKKPSSKTKITSAKINRNPLSIISLQNLLNRYLFDAIAANMGDGDSRNVLNYRTGRLAASAKVERLTSSREGLITAFYSYQKNPYATFSDGGRQQYPKTRDPKLLISKSIREIAAEYVSNQLRSVNI